MLSHVGPVTCTVSCQFSYYVTFYEGLASGEDCSLPMCAVVDKRGDREGDISVDG